MINGQVFEYDISNPISQIHKSQISKDYIYIYNKYNVPKKSFVVSNKVVHNIRSCKKTDISI